MTGTANSPIRPEPKKSDAEQTVQLLAKVVDEVKLDQNLPNKGERNLITFPADWMV